MPGGGILQAHQKLIKMEYVCVDARFKFFNGKDAYTVEYAYGLEMWFVFEDVKAVDALFKKKINPAKNKSPNRLEAEKILNEYLSANF